MKKKFLSILLSASLVITANSFTTTAYAESDNDLSISAESVTIKSGSAPAETSDELNMTLNYLPEIQPYGSFQGNDYILNTDTLTSEDAVDFYTFSLSGTRTVLLTLQTTADYIAIICPYDPATGDITVSANYPNVRKGEATAFVDINSNNQNNFCLVVLNLGTEYGASYTIAMNAKNNGYANQIVNFSNDFAYVTLGYNGGVYRMNGENVVESVQNYVSSNVPGVNDDIAEVFRKQYTTSTTGFYLSCTVFVKTCQAYLNMDNLIYGTYRNTSTAMPISSNAAIFIPVYGGHYECILNVSGKIRGDYGAPVDYLVYDLTTNRIIDWASTRNFFYNENTDMYTFEMHGLVSL